MNSKFFILLLIFGLALPSCVSKKKFTALQTELDAANKDLGKMGEDLSRAAKALDTCEQEKAAAEAQARQAETRNEGQNEVNSLSMSMNVAAN